MKKICLLLIAVSLLLSLVSCTQYSVIRRYEDNSLLKLRYRGIEVKDIDYETMLRYYEYFYTGEEPCYEMYLPREGEFVSEDGETLQARVDCYRLAIRDKAVGIRFYLFIYRTDGTLYLGEELTCSRASEDDALDGVVKITDAMREYWDAVKALPSEILAD